MKPTLITLVSLFLTFQFGCKEKARGEMPFSYTPDSTHFHNEGVLRVKENILKRVDEIDDWYRVTNNNIRYNSNYNTWKMKGAGLRPEPEVVVNYIRNEFPGNIKSTELLTNSLKEELNIKIEEINSPINLAGLISTDSNSYRVMNLYPRENFIYEEYLIYTHSIYPDAGDHDEYEPEVSDEKVKQCLLEMITVNENQATLALWLYLIDGLRESKPYYLTLYFDKVEGEWLLDDLQIHKDVK